jgi:hypothetical protein
MLKLFVDNINFFSLFWVVLYWLKSRRKSIHIYYFAISPTSKTGLRLLGQVLPVHAEEVDYSAAEIIADLGPSWYKTESEDMLSLCHKIREVELKDHPLVQRMGHIFGPYKFQLYLEKLLAEDLKPVMHDIRVIEWFRRVWELDLDEETLFFINRTPWHRYFVEYSNRFGIRMVPYFAIRGRGKKFGKRLLRHVVNRVSVRPGSRSGSTEGDMPLVETDVKGDTKIAVPYIGKGLTVDPSKNSDLFMLPFVKSRSGQVLLYFFRNDCPLDEDKKKWLDGAGIKYVAVHRDAVACKGVQVWQFKFDSVMRNLYIGIGRWLFCSITTLVGRNLALSVWLIEKTSQFISQYSYWRGFYNEFNIKLHLSYFDWMADNIAATCALSNLGGLSVSYQVSAAQFASLPFASAADVYFAFSLHGAKIKERSGSYISQYIAVGYNTDNSFGIVRGTSKLLRAELKRHGAKFIICYFDENSSDDKKVIWTHEHMRVDYVFLLRRLIEDSTLGLIFKPKKPNTLRARLGEVAELLDQGLATGRCFIFSQGELVTEALPNEASQAADVAIGFLHGITAATEAFLAGTPTLLIDRAYMYQHPYYKWGRDNVVFDNWDMLFAALTKYRHDPTSVPDFGDWAPVLDQLDPFVDGRAAERMGSYIHLLVKGIDKGLSITETLEQARQRYVELWDADKVVDQQQAGTIWTV